MAPSLAHLDKEYRDLALSLGKLGYVIQGSVFERKAGAGSRYQWTWKNKSQKTQSLTLTEEQYRWLRQAASNEQTLKRTLKKMRQISEQIFDRSSRKSPRPK
jgi:cyclopropane fatty-acyl-phospholipid synthase-like methyltransferase